MSKIFFYSLCLLIFVTIDSNAQKKTPNLIYIDKEGVMRYTAGNNEASFFGVNYTTPFAYAYRAHKALNVDLEKAIRQDVYHMARLGLNAFRVHVWDTEISDQKGNLLQNDHLRLFDFLIAELKKRNIRIIITPLAFWGNGYPERDEKTAGFSSIYNKERVTVNDTAIVAQENYMQQFFTHVNPYTKLSYGNDPGVIAVEINNEPSHGGPKNKVTEYINRLTRAVKKTGWTKPVFYNISQSPYYGDAVAASEVNGFSFQWYPSALVAGRTLGGNYLPNVDKYAIPFDTIPAFHKKALMVYEFDAADILSPYMYPAMARSYRTSGFQWATQFAYDPMALAYANTEYQTHYLNLAYTPAKAISLMIASSAFRSLPRYKKYGSYPVDSIFDSFRVSYKEDLSEMNTDTAFFYSGSTSAKPVDISKLKHIAGTGSSGVISYKGSGAYFLDKLENGVWRLEVMPDAIHIRDPFERASPSKEVTRIEWRFQAVKINLPDLKKGFIVRGINEGNNYKTTGNENGFDIYPGTYILSNDLREPEALMQVLNGLSLTEFSAPSPRDTIVALVHTPYREISAGKKITISMKLAGLKREDKITLQVNRTGTPGQGLNLPMTQKNSMEYLADIPADFITPGYIRYRVIISRPGNRYVVFPGAHTNNPYSWDNFHNDTWETFVAAEKTQLEIFNASQDRNSFLYPVFRRNFQTVYTAGERNGQLLLRSTIADLSDDKVFGFQHYFGDRLKGRATEISSFSKIVVRARSTGMTPVKAKIAFITKDAFCFSAYIDLTSELKEIDIPITSLRPDSCLLLPRPYPGFMPLWFKASGESVFSLSDVEKLEWTIGTDLPASSLKQAYGYEIERVSLK